MLAPTIGASEFGSLPTPQAYSQGQSASAPGLTPLDLAVRPEMARHVTRAKDRRAGVLPTPTASLGDGRGMPSPELAQARFDSGRRNLDDAVMLPTPTVDGNYNRKGASAKSGDGLHTALMLATPTARDWRSGKASQETMDRNSRPLSEQIGGLLNPEFVEKMMGWRRGWTALESSNDQHGEARRQKDGAVGSSAWTVRGVRAGGNGQASPGPLEAAGCGGDVSAVPHGAAQDAPCGGRQEGSREAVGRAHHGLDVHQLRCHVHQNEVPVNPENMLEVVRQPDGLAESLRAHQWGDWREWDEPATVGKLPDRASRLKCLGNGQVPQCAAEAWRQLVARGGW